MQPRIQIGRLSNGTNHAESYQLFEIIRMLLLVDSY